MICVSLSDLSLKECRAALKTIGFAEIRMDTMDLNREDIPTVFSSHPRLIATCRPGRFGREERLEKLLAAVRAGALYVDIELEADGDFRSEITALARSKGCTVIISHHDFERTAPRKDLEAVVDACFRAEADIAKIACRALTPRDSARLLGLLDDPRAIIVIGMGKEGRITRPAALMAGSPFTYASPAAGRETAPGQLDIEHLEAVLQYLKHV
jgi:3-dehydroquinate dehydratase type I